MYIYLFHRAVTHLIARKIYQVVICIIYIYIYVTAFLRSISIFSHVYICINI